MVCVVTEDKDRDSAKSHGYEVDNQERSPAILVAEVGKSPDISETYRDRDAGEQEVKRMAPVSSQLSLVNIVILGHI